MATTTIFALCLMLNGREGAVSFDADRTARPELEDRLFGEAGHAGLCWYVDTSDPARPRWVCSGPDAERQVQAPDVPPEVRKAGALWWARWAGRECAREWHENEPGTVPRGWDFKRWRMEQELPADGDLKFLVEGMIELDARRPTEAEESAFANALLERLFELTPTARRGAP